MGCVAAGAGAGPAGLKEGILLMVMVLLVPIVTELLVAIIGGVKTGALVLGARSGCF